MKRKTKQYFSKIFPHQVPSSPNTKRYFDHFSGKTKWKTIVVTHTGISCWRMCQDKLQVGVKAIYYHNNSTKRTGKLWQKWEIFITRIRYSRKYQQHWLLDSNDRIIQTDIINLICVMSTFYILHDSTLSIVKRKKNQFEQKFERHARRSGEKRHNFTHSMLTLLTKILIAHFTMDEWDLRKREW